LRRSLAATRAVALVVACVAVVACRQDMHNGPRYRPLRASEFFTDGSSVRMPVLNTVSRNPLADDDELLYTGKINGQFADMFPMPVTAQVLQRGQERYNIYCAPCHGRTGKGDGMIVQRGMRQPPSYMIDRLRQAPAGYFFDVATNGFGAMQDYASQVRVEDRWAIVAYERALQFSQHATVDDVPADRRAGLDQQAAAGDAPRREGQ